MNASSIVFMILSTGLLAQANIGGVNYNVGSYSCQEDSGELSGEFSFPTNSSPMSAKLTIKGTETPLNCQEARVSDPNLVLLFRKNYDSPSYICTGRSDKGTVVVGTTNSMGLVQMKAFLMNSQQVLAKSILNCNSVAQKRNSGW